MENATRRLEYLFSKYGQGEYTTGEPMTLTMHSAQTAELARQAGESSDLVAAALLHDVGHMLGFEAGLIAEMDGCGFEHHDEAVAAFLRALGFCHDVAFLTSTHVAAKRYLVAVDPDYAAKLSEASRPTLGFQGGPIRRTKAPELTSRAAAAADMVQDLLFP